MATTTASASTAGPAAVRTREQTVTNAGLETGADAFARPSAARDDSTDHLIGTATWTWNLSSDSFIEAKYNHDKEENSTDPLTDLGYRPAFDLETGMDLTERWARWANLL